MDKLHSEFGFTTPIPDVVIQAIPEIGSEGFTMFCYLMYRIYSDKRIRGDFSAWPSWKNMEIQTRMTRHKIGKGLKALEEHGFLTRRKRFSKSIIYTLRNPEDQFPKDRGNERGNDDSSSLIVRELNKGQFPNSQHTVPQQLGTNQEQLNQEQLKKEEPRTTTKTKPKNVVVASPSEKTLIDEIKALGIHWKRAQKLCAEFDHDELAKHLRITQQKAAASELSNPAGYFLTAVKENFEIPELTFTDSESDEERRQKYLSGWFDE